MWLDTSPETNPRALAASGRGAIVTAFAETIAVEETFRLDVEKPKDGRLLLAGMHDVGLGLDNGRRHIDISWLKAASEAYHISSDIKDYVLAEVPIVEGDVPNRNMNCFLTSRLIEFLPNYGCQAYQTFIGKPVFHEHDHDDNTRAKGVILDTSMRVVNGRVFVFNFKAFDRTKDRKLAEDVLHMRVTGHSMSAWTEFFDCAYCKHRFDTSYAKACACHKGPKPDGKRFLGLGQVISGRLVYNLPYRYRFFESSAVSDPACYSAWQTNQMVAP